MEKAFSFTPLRSKVLQRKCACGGTPGPTGECEACRKNRLQRKIGQPSALDHQQSEVPPIVHEVLRSPGQPLDADTRALMEPRFGHDFGNVRIHTDARAAESAQAVRALAYTVGRDVVFGAGQYAASATRQRALAHELTHVVQQRAGVHLKDGVGEKGDAYEQDADKMAQFIVEGRSNMPLLNAYRPDPVAGRAGGCTVQRQAAERDFGIPSAAPDVTYVAGRSSRDIENRFRFGMGKVTPTKKPTPEELRGMFSRFVGMLRYLDMVLQGNATQSSGMIIYGKGDGKDSPATKASKDAKIWGSFDFAAFMELMDIVLIAIPENSDPRKTLESLREELTGKPPNWQKLAELVKEIVENAEEMKKEAGVLETKKEAGTLETKRPRNQNINVPPKQIKEIKTTSPNTSKPTWYSRDPMGYWNSYPIVADFEGVSGDPFAQDGAIAIVTDKHGTRRKFRYWVDKDGYSRSEFLKPAQPPSAQNVDEELR
jgi:hypothetical protein